MKSNARAHKTVVIIKNVPLEKLDKLMDYIEKWKGEN